MQVQTLTTEKLQQEVVAVTMVTTLTLHAAAVSLVEVTTTVTVETEQIAAVHGATIPVQPATAGRSIPEAVQIIVLLQAAAVPHLQVKAVEAHQAAVVINS